MKTIQLTDEDLALLVDALDSHIYWGLSDEKYRDSGHVMDSGSDDEEQAEDLAKCRVLEARIDELRRSPRVVVHLRAPRAGERMFWVANWHDADRALAEVLREADESPPGWLSPKDEEWCSDEHDMRPVTVEVLA